MHQHILIIGGTGMLKEASIALAATCKTLTSVARTARSLMALDEAIKGTGTAHHRLALDWADAATFAASLSDHVNRVGMPDVVLAWVHDESLVPGIARAVCSPHGNCDFYQVRGSAAASPGAQAAQNAHAATQQPGMRVHEIVLGFHIDTTGSRWLLDPEICVGTVEAIQRRARRFVVGTTSPWSHRPQ